MLPSRRRAAVVAGVCLWAVAAGAQESPPSAAPPIVERPQTPPAAPEARSEPRAEPRADRPPSQADVADEFDVIYLKNKLGDLVPVLLGPELEDVLQQLARRRAAERPAETYSFARVSLDGDADGDYAHLSAQIQVQIPAGSGAVVVPFRMSEAVLKDVAHAGPGEATYDGYHVETGYRWRLHGAGLHTLTLTVSVPLRKEAPGRRLQCGLPAAAVSELKLRVPGAKITAKSDEKSPLTVTPLPSGGSQIGAIGLGTRVDVRWEAQPEATSGEAVLEARTSISASLDEEAVLLEATQRVLALQGTFQEVRVRLPAGADVLKVEGTTYKEHTQDKTNLNQVVVTLKETSAGPVDLRWTIRLPMSGSGDGNVQLEGFEVERARVQTGYVALRPVGGYRVARLDRDDRFVQRVNVADLAKVTPAMPAQGETASAFRILKQPFRLDLKLEKLQPYVSVRPALFLKFAHDQLEFEGLYRYEVFRGGVDELTFRWPGWKQEGWRIEPVEAPGQVEQTVVTDVPEDEAIRLRMIERTSGEVTLRLRAVRPLAESPATFSLPTPSASSRLPAELFVGAADNLEIDFKPTGTTSVRPPVFSAERPAAPPLWRDLQRLSYLTDSRDATFSASWTVHKQQLRSETELTATIEEDATELRQALVYDVSYERLAHVLLWIPASLAGRCRFFDPAGTELIPTETGVKEGDAAQVRLSLDEPRLGRVEIAVTSRLPAGDAETRSLPFVRAADARSATTVVRLRTTAPWTAAVQDPNWRKQAASGGAEAWSAEGERSQVVVQVQREREGARSARVARIYVREAFDAGGRLSARAQYRIEGRPTVARIELPTGVEPIGFFWNTRRLAVAERPATSTAPRSFEAEVPDAGGVDETHLLTIDYFAEPAAGGSDARPIVVPAVAWDQTAAATVVEVQLPADQLLFVPPEGLTPLFAWRRTGLFWTRQAFDAPESYRTWIGAEDGPGEAGLSSTTLASSYRFSRFGAPQPARFRTIPIWLTVFIGAGVAAVLGTVLMTYRMARHMLTALLLLIVVAGAALWQPEPVLLLLQPAGLGFALAVGMALLQGGLRRLREPRELTLTSPSGFRTPASSIAPTARAEPASVRTGSGVSEFTGASS